MRIGVASGKGGTGKTAVGSRGGLICDALPDYAASSAKLLQDVTQEATTLSRI
jgi:hypothetical protein